MTAVDDQVRATPEAYRTVGFGNLLRSEWTKLRSLRSTYLCGALTVVMTVGLAVIMGIRWSHETRPLPVNFDATNVSLTGFYLAQVVAGALGVMVISSEYATRMIWATTGAVPQRRSLLAAKATVLGIVVLVVGELCAFVSFAVGQALLAHRHAGVSLSDPGVLRAVIGAGLYLTVMSLLGFGLGAVIRYTAGALSAFFGLVFALNAVIEVLPDSWRSEISDYLPLNAGGQIMVILREKGGLAPWTGLGVLALYAVAALIAAFVVVEARDV